MDGAWYTRRHYYSPMSVEQLVKGPQNGPAPSSAGKWRVVKAKNEGVTPGLEFIDSANRRYVLKFDPLAYPEIATGPDVLVSKFFHALGYHAPDNYVVHFMPDPIELSKDVKLVDTKGKERLMERRDLTEMLLRVPRDSEGRYRGGVSLFLKGKPIGPYKYYGLRADDPNDIVRHEHRRDLRGLGVFCPWLAHDDSRSINSLDMVVEAGGTPYIRHHLIDFGSTLGSASYGPNSPRSGFEYVFSWGPTIKQLFTFGLAVPDLAKAKYPNDRAVGRFESKRFDAAGWLAEYPNPAFTNRLPDDGFWAAKQVMAFTDEQIRAIVATGEYSRKESAEWIANALIERRDKIGRAFFAQVLPLDKFANCRRQPAVRGSRGEARISPGPHHSEGLVRLRQRNGAEDCAASFPRSDASQCRRRGRLPGLRPDQRRSEGRRQIRHRLPAQACDWIQDRGCRPEVVRLRPASIDDAVAAVQLLHACSVMGLDEFAQFGWRFRPPLAPAAWASASRWIASPGLARTDWAGSIRSQPPPHRFLRVTILSASCGRPPLRRSRRQINGAWLARRVRWR